MLPVQRPAPQRGLTPVELMVLFSILGMLAAVAVPTFYKQARRARVAEAVGNVRRLHDGLATYYVTERADAGGAFQPRRFPESAGNTPAFGTCCERGGRCAPDPAYWDGRADGSQTWQQLGFSITQPFSYSYHVWRQAGDGRQVGDAIIVGAWGDLDCDGFPGQFGRMLYVAQDHTLISVGSLWTWNELE